MQAGPAVVRGFGNLSLALKSVVSIASASAEPIAVFRLATPAPETPSNWRRCPRFGVLGARQLVSLWMKRPVW